MKNGKAWRITKETFKEFGEDKVLRLSAAMAYYTIFSIGPLLVLVVGLVGLVFGENTVRKAVAENLQSLVGSKGACMVESMMTSRGGGSSLWATIIGGVGLVLGAAGVFGQLQDALNTIWEVKAKPGVGIWGFLRDRFFSMAMVLGIGFLLLVSMALTAFVHAFSGYLGAMMNMPDWVAPALNSVLSFLIITFLFALIFKVLPDVKIAWGHVWVGAIGTALLFTLGKFALGLYLGREGATSAYGAGSALVLVLMYIYYSSIILFLGAEFTQVYARFSGARIEPSRYAMRIPEAARAHEGIPHSSGRHEPAPAFASQTAGHSMHKKTRSSSAAIPIYPAPAPGEALKARPWSFLGLALAAGVTAGMFMKVKTLRKGLKFYLLARRII